MGAKSRRWSLGGLLGLKKKPPPAVRVETKYHAVSIIPGEDACPAAYRFTGHRFLSRQAPPLPLPTCDAFQCTCKFKHHKDRRAGPRRRSDIGLMPGAYAGSDRRGPRGRRVDDF
jgi:hypothetical protein